jgi:hypothetical protein
MMWLSGKGVDPHLFQQEANRRYLEFINQESSTSTSFRDVEVTTRLKRMNS